MSHQAPISVALYPTILNETLRKLFENSAIFLRLESGTSLHIAFIHLALLKNSPTDFLKNALKTTYYKPGVFEECILGSADDRSKSNIFNYILRQIDFEFDMKDSLNDHLNALLLRAESAFV